MPKQIFDSKTRKEEDILRLLDKVIKTGAPVELERKGRRLLIIPAEKYRELDNLEEHPDFVVGSPDDLIHIDWSSEWKPQT
jgi:hypothetical protein